MRDRCGECPWGHQVNDRVVRNLAHLEESASTARVLNLLRVWRKRSGEPSYSDNPFFQNPALNQSIILKHRLRGHERDLFYDARQTATKVIIPSIAVILSLVAARCSSTRSTTTTSWKACSARSG